MKDKIKEFNENGFMVIEDILSSIECDNYKTLIKKIYPKIKKSYIQTSVASDHGLDDKNNEEIIFNLHNKNFSFVELLDHPKLLPLISSVLQKGSYKDSEPFIYMNSAARNVLSGFPEQQLHIDSRFPASTFALNIQVFWLLDDFTEQNGSTRIIPKSHTIPSYPENSKKYDNEVLLTARKGSVVVFNGSCWHGASKKMNDEDRWALIYTFGRWFLKPSFDFNKNMPKEIYDKMNDIQKEIMGYKFNPPKDEFTRISSRSKDFEEPIDYKLP